MRQGEVYWADLPEAGPHMLIVVSREELNRGNRVLAVPVTSRHFERRSRLPNCVPFRSGEHGFSADCVAQCDAVISLLKMLIVDPESGPVATLPDEVFRDVVVAMGYVMDSTCEPN